jgi:hypothetical protein
MDGYGANVVQIIIDFVLHIGYQAVILQSFAISVETIPNTRRICRRRRLDMQTQVDLYDLRSTGGASCAAAVLSISRRVAPLRHMGQ